jgi:hypothetical protein
MARWTNAEVVSRDQQEWVPGNDTGAESVDTTTQVPCKSVPRKSVPRKSVPHLPSKENFLGHPAHWFLARDPHSLPITTLPHAKSLVASEIGMAGIGNPPANGSGPQKPLKQN